MNKNKNSAKIYTLIVNEIAEGKLFRSIVFFFMLINAQWRRSIYFLRRFDLFLSMNKNMRTCKSISAIIPLGTVTWYTLDNKTMKWKGSIGKRESARGSKVLKHFSQVLLQRMEKTGEKLRIRGQWGMKVVSDHFHRREHSFLVCQFAVVFFQRKKR